jgi:G3E family GTPase
MRFPGVESEQPSSDPRTPVDLITGFLGSGKTTLLAGLLAHPGMSDTVVIVNEIGEAGIDHHMLRRVDERTVLMSSGCLCCSLRGDLADELADLSMRRGRGEIRSFRRVVVETTGLAEPAPVVYTLLNDPAIRPEYRLERVITTVDAVHGLHGEVSLRQVAAADRLVITKSDLADSAELVRRLEQLNPAAEIIIAPRGSADPVRLLGGGEGRHGFAGDVSRRHAHDGIDSVCLLLDEELDWTVFGVWLTMLLAARGQQILRVKGMLDTGAPGPAILDGVQHVLHPVRHLDAWPDHDHRSRLVFIGHDLDLDELMRSLRAFSQSKTLPK